MAGLLDEKPNNAEDLTKDTTSHSKVEKNFFES